MSTFTLYNLESAPTESKPLLEKSKQSMGMIPNLYGIMAAAPALLEAYQELDRLFMKTSFTVEEKTVIWQTINVENECHYCVPAHTAIAHMMKVDAKIIEALNNQTPLPNDRLETLRNTTLALIRGKGRLSQQEHSTFSNAGFTSQQLLEIVLGLSQKILSNYTNHLANTEIDEPFQKYVWNPS